MPFTLRSGPTKIITIALVVVGMLIVATSNAGPAPQITSSRTLDEIVASGELIMLTFPHQESVFSRTNLEQGTPMPRLGSAADFRGIDVDLMSSFADSLGVELRIRPVSEPRYSALIPDLLTGRGDLIASSLTITRERLQKVDFARPYFEVYPVIVTLADSELTGFEELQGHIGAVTAGSSHEQRLLRLGIEPSALARVDFTIETYAAVLEEEADYTLADSRSAMRYLSSEPRLKVAFRLEGSDQYGVAVPKDRPDLLGALNSFFDRAHRSGEIERALAKHNAQQAPLPSGTEGGQQAAN